MEMYWSEKELEAGQVLYGVAEFWNLKNSAIRAVGNRGNQFSGQDAWEGRSRNV